MQNQPPRAWSALVVEPERARLAVLQEILRALGCTDVVVAKDAEGALIHLTTRTPRIVLCAGRMAGLDGFEFTRRLRRSEQVRDCAVSVVLTIAGAERGDVISALNAGADSILPFPMSVAQLGNLLKALDTQKRPFVRAATYVGPCRRRGLVQGDGETHRRLEDFGAADALKSMMTALRRTFDMAQRGGVSQEWAELTARALAIYLTEARGDRKIDEAALHGQCLALIGQFVVHAPGQPSFEHAFIPLRRMLVTVISKSRLPPDEERAA